MIGDLGNAFFEWGGALAVAVNLRKLWQDRELRGSHWASTVFFTSWSAWNIGYYPSLHQWVSASGAAALLVINLLWLLSLVYFRRLSSGQA